MHGHHLSRLRQGIRRDALRVVVSAFDLSRPARLFTRCRVCNGRVRPLGRKDAKGKVPPRVWARAERFARCSACGRVYWEGSHTARMRAVLAEVFRKAKEGREPRRVRRGE